MDLISLWVGRAVLCGGGVALAIYLACRVLDIVIQRAGMAGMMLKFCWLEFRKSPRPLAARLFWGQKKEE